MPIADNLVLSCAAVFRIHEYLPDPVVPYFEAGVDTLLDLLTKANVISDVKRTRKSGDESEPESESRSSGTLWGRIFVATDKTCSAFGNLQTLSQPVQPTMRLHPILSPSDLRWKRRRANSIWRLKSGAERLSGKHWIRNASARIWGNTRTNSASLAIPSRCLTRVV